MTEGLHNGRAELCLSQVLEVGHPEQCGAGTWDKDFQWKGRGVLRSNSPEMLEVGGLFCCGGAGQSQAFVQMRRCLPPPGVPIPAKDRELPRTPSLGLLCRTQSVHYE